MVPEPLGLKSEDQAWLTFASLSACVCPETVTNRLAYAVGAVQPPGFVEPALPAVAAPLPPPARRGCPRRPPRGPPPAAPPGPRRARGAGGAAPAARARGAAASATACH